MKKWLAVVGLVASLGCRRVESTKAAGDPVVTVAVARATRSDLSQKLTLTAEFKPYQEIDVMAKVAGYVQKINVDIGDRVRQGQLLAVLEVPEMADDEVKAKAEIDRSQAQVGQSQEEVRRSQAAYDIARLSYQRLNSVSQSHPGLVAQQEVDEAQARASSADAQVSAAKSNVLAAQRQVNMAQAELARLETLYAYTKVTAPFDGVVTRRFADTGSMIQAGTASQTQAMPLVRVSQNSLLRLILPVPESVVSTVHAGQSVDVHVPTLNRTFPGKVVRFADRLSLETRTMDTEVDVPNPSLMLIPGMYAEVDLTIQQANGALTVPVNAVEADADNSHEGRVLSVGPDNRLAFRKVALGLQTADRVQIVSGLREGDTVVVGSRSGLQPGTVVRAKETTLTAEKQ
jgi:RND family efflux transporter MFP subunit